MPRSGVYEPVCLAAPLVLPALLGEIGLNAKLLAATSGLAGGFYYCFVYFPECLDVPSHFTYHIIRYIEYTPYAVQ